MFFLNFDRLKLLVQPIRLTNINIICRLLVLKVKFDCKNYAVIFAEKNDAFDFLQQHRANQGKIETYLVRQKIFHLKLK